MLAIFRIGRPAGVRSGKAAVQRTWSINSVLPWAQVHVWAVTECIHPCAALSLLPPFATTPLLQSSGRSSSSTATCPTRIAADAGCAASRPSLALASGPNTKWTFVPAGGASDRYYILLSVSSNSFAAAQGQLLQLRGARRMPASGRASHPPAPLLRSTFPITPLPPPAVPRGRQMQPELPGHGRGQLQ